MKTYFIIIALFCCYTMIAFTQNLTVKSGKKGNMAVLAEPLPEYNRNTIKKLANDLRKQGFGITLLNAEQVCNPHVLSTNFFFAFIIPNANVYPMKGYSALQDYAKHGGHIVFAGGPAFEKPSWKIGNKWQTLAEIKTKYKIKNTHSYFNMNKPVAYYGWTRQTYNYANTCSWELVDDIPEKGMKSFHFLCENFEGWDGYITKTLDLPLYKNGDNLICFKAKGDSNTPQIAVELQENDGSRWFATVPVNTNWQHVFLPVNSFKYWPESPTKEKRGGNNDKIQPENVCRINFGLSTSHTPYSATEARHEFFVSEIGTASDPVLSEIFNETENSPVFETISPSYKVYTLTNIVKAVSVAPWQTTNSATKSKYKVPRHGVSPIPRTQGRGFERKQKYRWISLVDAMDANNHRRGSLFWLLLNQNSPLSNSCFVGLASSEPEFLNSAAVTDTLGKTLDRLNNGLLLIDAGANHFSVWPGEKIELGANLLRFHKNPEHTVLRFTVEKTDGSIALNREFKVDFQDKQNFVTNFMWTAPKLEEEVLQVNVSVLVNGKLVDKITHDLGILYTDSNNKNNFVKTKGNQFILNGKPWYPVGVNYWPAYVSGVDPKDFWAGWISRSFYEPEEVERDLILMEKMGINMLSIQSFSLETYRNLLDFLRRCDAHNIKVNLFIGMASPLNLNEKSIRQYIKNAKLASNTTLFAYDIIWEPGNYVFNKDNRHKWDKDWKKWICDQYGSIIAAEKDWLFSVPRDSNRKVTSPPDKYFREDGEWRVMMAAYRRFMNNLISRKWNRACSALRKIDPNHLISFRQGNTLPHDFTFTATSKHIDFICPEGYAIKNNEDGYNSAGFITRFVHFTTGGKPILWAEFGKHVWDKNRMRPSEKLIKEQGDYHKKFYKMVLESGANGLTPWWWTGGYRVDEQSDYGIIEPDGRLRKSAHYLAKYAPLIKTPRKWPVADKMLEIDLDKHSGGYWFLCFNEGKDAYREARLLNKNLGIKTRGSGTTSVSTPLIAVGNRPYNGHNPPKYLDAEFNWFKVFDANGNWTNAVNGSIIEVSADKPVRVKVSLGNMQEAAWIPPAQTKNRQGGVVLTSTDHSDILFRQPIAKSVPYLGNADLGEFILCKPPEKAVKVEARMQAEGRCVFGEIRRFILKPSKPQSPLNPLSRGVARVPRVCWGSDGVCYRGAR